MNTELEIQVGKSPKTKIGSFKNLKIENVSMILFDGQCLFTSGGKLSMVLYYTNIAKFDVTNFSETYGTAQVEIETIRYAK